MHRSGADDPGRRSGRRFAASRGLAGGEHRLTLLYTNDFHSAFDPIPGYWLPGSPRLGGAEHLASLVERERARAATSFLLDSGDMYTGTLSFLTRGEALMELMTVMRYDAMGVRAARYTIMPSRVNGVEFTDPVAEASELVRALRPVVDLVVVLAHQGLPGPMQTDAENDPRESKGATSTHERGLPPAAPMAR